MNKIFVIGDIHGCYEAFVELLNKIHPAPQSDTLIFLGDYVDRGPNSKDVIAKLVQLQKKFPKMIALKGNHEVVFLNYLSGNDIEFYLAIGGTQTLASYGIADPFDEESRKRMIPPEHLNFLHTLLPYWEDDEYIYVHAGLKPGTHLSQQPPDWLYWANGGRFANQAYDFGKRVIFGHTAGDSLIITPEKIGIDTGAVYGGRLTCLILPDMEVVSVKSPKYWPIP